MYFVGLLDVDQTLIINWMRELTTTWNSSSIKWQY